MHLQTFIENAMIELQTDAVDTDLIDIISRYSLHVWSMETGGGSYFTRYF